MKTIQVVSFDVFDTVLTRLVGEPADLFLFLGSRLKKKEIINILPNEFMQQRIEAERRARSKAEKGAPDLLQIYKELQLLLGMQVMQATVAMEEEIRLEVELIRPIPGADKELRQHRLDRRRIVFLSDMYLSSEFIKNQLKKYGLWDEKDRIYVSCEEKKTKSSGDLFKHMVMKENTKLCFVLHKGDNFKSDIEIPRRLGIKIHPFFKSNLNRYERILETYSSGTGGLASLMAGASRLARLQMQTEKISPFYRTICDVAASVAAPTLSSFVLWVLLRAKERGLKRLYFVSRDGYILLEIARILAKKLNIECELRYLYGSRQAWNLPSLMKLEEKDFKWILAPTKFLSIESVLFRVGIIPEEIKHILKLYGFSEVDWRRNLTGKERSKLNEILRHNTIKQTILAKAAERREILIEYLKQEELFSIFPSGLVNIGWHGIMEDSLANIILLNGGNAPMCFYFGLFREQAEKSLCLKEAYLFDKGKNIGFLSDMVGIKALIEMFCPLTHGLVVGYKRKNSHIVPIFKEGNEKLVRAWGKEYMLNIAIVFSQYLAEVIDLVNPEEDLRPTIAHLLKTFWEEPTVEEAVTFGDYPCEDDQSAVSWTPLAPKYGIIDWCRSLLKGSTSYEGEFWPSGAKIRNRLFMYFFMWILWIRKTAMRLIPNPRAMVVKTLIGFQRMVKKNVP